MQDYQHREEEAYEEYIDMQQYQEYLKTNYKKKIGRLHEKQSVERDTVTSQNSVLQDKVDRLHRELDALQDMLKRIQRENEHLKKDKNYRGSSPDKRLTGIIQKLMNDNR